MRDKKKLSEFEGFLGNFSIVNVDLEVTQEFAKIRSGLRKAGKLIDNFDILIAASCKARNLILVTRNTSHFKRVKGLKIFKIEA